MSSTMQVLVTKDEMGDGGEPCVRVTFKVPVGTVSTSIGFEREEHRDRAFDQVDEEAAFRVRSSVIESSSSPLKKLMGEVAP